MTQSILDNTNLSLNKAEAISEAILNNGTFEDNVFDTQQDGHGNLTSNMATSSNCAQSSVTSTTAVSLTHPSKFITRKASRNRKYHQSARTRNSSPSEDEIRRRQQLVAQLQQERTWCKICQPPIKFSDFTYRNIHRKQKHGLDSEGPLKVFCDKCQRSHGSTGFWKHVCIDQTVDLDEDNSLIPCPHFDVKFSKYGVKNHSVKCPAKKNP